ncbi:hypothetical protein AURDEDRAFT_112621 [Auricularia subglabra TFB-10046 SS5]|nr:hypothetical protein AURDEDRAFT_112621 [Auricularia subglabra TFB-10046 SS5]
MTCTSCHAYFCYICRQQIAAGYDHFGENPYQCPLYDAVTVDERHNAEVRAAERDARARYMHDQVPEAGPAGARYAIHPDPDDDPAPGNVGLEPVDVPEDLAEPPRGAWYPMPGLPDPLDPVRRDEYLFPVNAVPANLGARAGAGRWQGHHAADDAVRPGGPPPQDFTWFIHVPYAPPDFPYGRERWSLYYYHSIIGLPPPPLDMPLPEYCEPGCTCDRGPYCFVTYSQIGEPGDLARVIDA